MSGAISHSLNTPSWRDNELKKAQGLHLLPLYVCPGGFTKQAVKDTGPMYVFLCTEFSN